MKKIIVCINHRSNPAHPSCARRGGNDIADLLEKEIARLQLDISLERFKCLGDCERGPNLKMAPDGPFLHHVDPAQTDLLLSAICQFATAEPTTDPTDRAT